MKELGLVVDDADADDEMSPAEREEVIRRVRDLDLTSCDFVGDEGCCDPDCWRCHSPLRPENLRTLARNFAFAAALCRSWQLGKTYGDDPRMDGPAEWAPGCGTEAP